LLRQEEDHEKMSTFYQLFDNSFHMARSEEFVLLPHSKDASGCYHVFGEAVLAPRDTQFDLFRTCLPLLKLSEGKKALILSPLPRYLYERCCADKDQVVGLEENGHCDRMWEDAEKSRTFLNDFAWTCGVRHAKTLNPGRAVMEAVLLEEEEDRGMWGDDPVHPTGAAYSSIARAVIIMAQELGGGPPIRKRTEATEGQPHKKARMGPSGSMGGWDTPRHLRGNLRGRGRGWRGGSSSPRPPFRARFRRGSF
jgi:hypothetical protein